MLQGVWLRSAFAVAVSATYPAVVLDASATPSHVPETLPEVGLTGTELGWLAGDCAASCAVTLRLPADGSTRDVLHVVPSLQKVSRCPVPASRSSMRYPILPTSSLAVAAKVMGLPGAAIDGPFTAMLTASQWTLTRLDDAAAAPVGIFWPGVITYATNEWRPALPVYATVHMAACVHAPTRLRSVTSKISIAHGVPVTLGVDFATSNVVAPDASTELSALNLPVGTVGWTRSDAPPAVITGSTSVPQAPGANTSLSPSAAQAVRPVGTAELPA